MSQNSLRYNWTREEVDGKLKQIMSNIHASCVAYGTNADGYVDYVKHTLFSPVGTTTINNDKHTA